MNRKAYVVMAIEGALPVVRRVGIYSEASPTQEGNYLQVVLAEAEGSDYADASRRAAFSAAQRAMHVRGLVPLFCVGDLEGAMKVALHQQALLRRGIYATDVLDAWLLFGKVPT